MLSDLSSYAIAVNPNTEISQPPLKSTPWYCVALIAVDTSLLAVGYRQHSPSYTILGPSHPLIISIRGKIVCSNYTPLSHCSESAISSLHLQQDNLP